MVDSSTLHRFFSYGTDSDFDLDISYLGFFVILPILLLTFWVRRNQG